MEDKLEEFFFGTDKDNMSIDEYLKRINNITKYYYQSCEKYKKRLFVSLIGITIELNHL